jgi:sulfate adenylyltransferase
MATPDEREAGRLVGTERAEELRAAARDWPSWSLTARQLADLELLLNGSFDPLAGYLGRADHASVLDRGALADGTPWPVPITLDVQPQTADDAERAGHLALRDPEGVLLAVLEVRERFEPDRVDEAERLFDTRDERHPGVDRLLRHIHAVRLGGPVEGVELPVHWTFAGHRLTPRSAQAAVQAIGVDHVAGFATADPPLGDDLDALQAASDAGAAVLVAVVVGPGGSAFDPFTVMRAWHAARHRLPAPSMLGAVPLARVGDDARDRALAGVVLRNLGATEVLPAAAADGAPDAGAMRSRLDRGLDLPAGAAAPEVEAELRRSCPPVSQRGLTVFMTGLSGSGKSTVAQALAARLRERGGRSVALLDGDLVRHHLSSELGFSREHRDLNIRRIGFVAAEITRAGGIAICAPIAPYDDVRRDVRAMVEEAGGFVLVHIATPLEVCEARDRKGLYAKARAGIIGEFTGISDPYEVPTDAELTIDTTDIDVEEAVDRILAQLTAVGYLAAERD